MENPLEILANLEAALTTVEENTKKLHGLEDLSQKASKALEQVTGRYLELGKEIQKKKEELLKLLIDGVLSRFSGDEKWMRIFPVGQSHFRIESSGTISSCHGEFQYTPEQFSKHMDFYGLCEELTRAILRKDRKSTAEQPDDVSKLQSLLGKISELISQA